MKNTTELTDVKQFLDHCRKLNVEKPELILTGSKLSNEAVIRVAQDLRLMEVSK